ncbi:MAG: AbrB/MazE/SpoVT family DNA-binding domain-containing protein [Dehalococcoidales bacterium]|nr:AbrB/MazE/SpoVT family DNA-binding domain-containing protein [Dehalococcoidales bacterium]
MKTRVQKWGNSLALRIPKTFADEAGLQRETSVELSVLEGKLLVTPLAKPRPTLRQLLVKITPENQHQEIETGHPAGKEIL